MGSIQASGHFPPQGLSLAATSSAFQLVAEDTVSGSAATTVTFTGLDINSDEHYILLYRITNTATGSWISLYVNNDTTATNYYSQTVDVNATTFTGSRNNAPYIGNINASDEGVGIVNIFRDVSGYFKFASDVVWHTGASVSNLNFRGSKTATVTNITQLDITASTANALGINSTFKLYRVISNG